MQEYELRLRELVTWLTGSQTDAPDSASVPSQSSPAEPAETDPRPLLACVLAASTEDLEQVCNLLLANFDSARLHPIRLRGFFQSLASRLLQASAAEVDSDRQGDQEHCESSGEIIAAELIGTLYVQLQSVDPTAAAHALQCLAAQADQHSIGVLSGLLEESPPNDWPLVGIALSPLWNASWPVLEQFFEAAGDGLLNAVTVSVLLDLANHAYRTGKLADHPFASRTETLIELLKQVTIRLEKAEKSPEYIGGDVSEIQRRLSDSVALMLSLSDALGLLGDSSACPVLAEAMELSHRRIQTEAAAALVRLGDQRGKKRLVQLAADPAARRRAVSYAEELELEEEIDQVYRLPAALAESELVTWLATAEQFAIPPQSMELVDSRTLYWPGYEEPRDCYLFRFHYELPQGNYQNLGIAGPLAHAFPHDLTSLTIEDVYSAFAGWHAEHDEIYEVPAEQFNLAQRQEAERLHSYMEQQGCRVIRCIALTFLLGEISLLATVQSQDKQYMAIADGETLIRYPLHPNPALDCSQLVLAVYRGRKLLRAFNPQELF